MAILRQFILRKNNDQLRTKLFPDIADDQIWDRRSKTGFATVPRAMPILMVLMDELSPRKPVSAVFLSLWCRAWDNPLVKLGNQFVEIAAEAGFTGQRAVHSLNDRLAILERVGMVKFAEGPGGRFGYALLLNPYLVLKKQKKDLSKFNWNALIARMEEIGATDFDPPPQKQPEAAPQPPAATQSNAVAAAPKSVKPPIPFRRR